MNRSVLLASAGVLLLGLIGCGNDADPPAADAKICGATMASWWYDATGGGTLTGMLDGQKLPLTNPTQSDVSYAKSSCTVFSDGTSIGGYTAELSTGNEVLNSAAQIERRPADRKFTAAGGTGAVDGDPTGGNIITVWWTYKSTLLSVEVTKTKDEETRIELVKTLAQRVAEVTGCPGPVPKAS